MLRPLPARQGRLVPVPAAEAHVRLVSSIEEEADAAARHPSRWAPRPGPGHRSGDASLHRSGDPSLHPSGAGKTRALKPMPSAEPLPKPSVIARRRAGTTGPRGPRHDEVAPHRGPSRPRRSADAPSRAPPRQRRRPGLARHLTRLPRRGRPRLRRSRRRATRSRVRATGPYAAWNETHPEAFVMSLRRVAGTKTPTLHRWDALPSPHDPPR